MPRVSRHRDTANLNERLVSGGAERGFLGPLFGGQSEALMWALGADKIPAEGRVFAHYCEETHGH